MLQVRAESPLKTKKSPIYIRRSVHQRVRVLAGLEDKTLQETIEDILPRIVEQKIAARLLSSTDKNDYKRKQRRAA